MEIVHIRAVREFIIALPRPLAKRTDRMIDMLALHGNMLRQPYSKAVGSGLFELRVAGAIQVRVLYFFHDDRAILAHALIKKEQKLSRRDIAHALWIKRLYTKHV